MTQIKQCEYHQALKKKNDHQDKSSYHRSSKLLKYYWQFFYAVYYIPVTYLFYNQKFVPLNPILPIYPSSLFPFGNYKFVFYACESVSVL